MYADRPAPRTSYGYQARIGSIEEVKEIMKDHGESALQNASAAIDVDGILWIGSFHADRVAYKPAP
jgi:hypothetical protein